MKARIERERIPPSDDPQFHLKLGRGSLSRCGMDRTAPPAADRHQGDRRPARRWTASSGQGHWSQADTSLSGTPYRLLCEDEEPLAPRGNFVAGAGGVVGSGADAMPRQPRAASHAWPGASVLLRRSSASPTAA